MSSFIDQLLATVVTPEERLRHIHKFVASYCETHPYGPTVREICEAVGGSTSTIHNALNNLREEGVLDWVDGQARTLHLTNV
jgi:SOS-response transcriptional repressor LexA